MQSVLVLGRQPILGIAEVEALYGAAKVRPVSSHAVVVDVDPCLLAFDRLGGATKFCKLLTILDTTQWKKIETFLIQTSPEHSKMMPEGKMTLGLSAIGLDVNIRQMEATGLSIKKGVRKLGRPVRLVPNKELELNTAQVLHNKLTGPNGWELVFIRDGAQTIVAQTVKIQDIVSYTRRDRERPKRDAKVGMLPPKLAQIIINLAAGPIPEEKLSNICDIPAGTPIPPTILNQTLLDPFCGTGVVLQEAMLMGYSVSGTDLEKRMVDYTYANLEWLRDNFGVDKPTALLNPGDATNHVWGDDIDIVACETYLGRPFTERPSPEMLAQTMSDCNLIIKKFLKNIYGQLKPGTRLCIALPAWQTHPHAFKHLPLLDSLEDIGYNRISFEHAGDEQLIYYREGQIVARQLIVITRK
jgi:SAM-dependent methyltransferase